MSQVKGKLVQWVDARFPLFDFWRNHMSGYYAPKNFNIWYFFGSLALLVLVNQLLSGIWLAMSYIPSAEHAFDSVEYIMRDVNFGWLIRYLHSTGASAFFIVIYLHMLRSLLYGSHKRPRELVWIFGMLLYVLLMAEAFMGYLLPWGQMSYWAAQVITSLFGAIPYVGDALATWIRGDYTISGVTLGRFYAIHVVLIPILIIGFVLFHLTALHKVGSNNPDGTEIKKHRDENGHPKDGVPFHPYYTVKDLMGAAVFLILFLAIVFFMPEFGGYFLEHANFQPANPLVTPEHIAPVWYMTPYYAILRAVPDKLLGVLSMFFAIFVWFLLPWLDRSKVRSIRYRGIFTKIALTLFVISFVSLGYLGLISPTPMGTFMARVFAIIYFAYFLLMPIYTKYEKTKPVPERVT